MICSLFIRMGFEKLSYFIGSKKLCTSLYIGNAYNISRA